MTLGTLQFISLSILVLLNHETLKSWHVYDIIMVTLETELL